MHVSLEALSGVPYHVGLGATARNQPSLSLCGFASQPANSTPGLDPSGSKTQPSATRFLLPAVTGLFSEVDCLHLILRRGVERWSGLIKWAVVVVRPASHAGFVYERLSWEFLVFDCYLDYIPVTPSCCNLCVKLPWLYSHKSYRICPYPTYYLLSHNTTIKT
jgi:hypothetical protein